MIPCKKCGKVFDSQFGYKRHIETKNDCTASKSLLNEVDKWKTHECGRCGKKYSTVSNLNQHIKNTTTSCYLKYAYYSCIRLFKPGREILDHITKNVFLKLLTYSSFTNFIVGIVKFTYFNSLIPENCNWCIVYTKNVKAGLEFDENTMRFERTSTDNLINNRIFNIINTLTPLIKKLFNKEQKSKFLTKNQLLNLTKCHEYIGQNNLSNDDDDIINVVRDFAYIHRSIPMNVWSKQGFTGNHISINFSASS
jgi:DNA-directed RNA polymerase beta' subunit